MIGSPPLKETSKTPLLGLNSNTTIKHQQKSHGDSHLVACREEDCAKVGASEPERQDASLLSNTSPTTSYQKVFIRQVPKRVDSQVLRAVLEKFGQIAYLRVPFSLKRKKNMGYGFVIFADQKTADLFLNDSSISVEVAGAKLAFSKFFKSSEIKQKTVEASSREAAQATEKSGESGSLSSDGAPATATAEVRHKIDSRTIAAGEQGSVSLGIQQPANCQKMAVRADRPLLEPEDHQHRPNRKKYYLLPRHFQANHRSSNLAYNFK